jgi:hypothetical protein
MALTINISNSGQTKQDLSLFSSGATGDSNFVFFPNSDTYQFSDSDAGMQAYWSYLGNNQYNCNTQYGFQLQYQNAITGSSIGLLTPVIPTGTGSPTQVGNAITSGLNALGLNVKVVVSLTQITPSLLSVNYIIDNFQTDLWNFIEVTIIDGYGDPSYPLILNNTISYLAGNPNVTSTQNVPLSVIQQSTTGYSYLIKSMYAVSNNQDQLLQRINYGYRDANGSLQNEILANVFDPYSGNSVAIRSKGMNNFIFDDSTVFQFDILPKSNVSIKYEFEQMGYDEIKKQAVGVELRKKFAEMEMENEEKADDFQNFYFFE